MRSLTTLIIALATAVAMGGCGDGDPTATSTADAPPTTDARTTRVEPSKTAVPQESPEGPSDSEAATPAASPSGNDVALPTATASPTLSIEVEAYEWRFQPDIWSVPAGEELTLEFTNRGGTEHDWALLALGETIAKLSEFNEDMVLFKVEQVPRGEAVTETLTIDEPGTYQVICTLSGHFNTGMGGSLTVR